MGSIMLLLTFNVHMEHLFLSSVLHTYFW